MTFPYEAKASTDDAGTAVRDANAPTTEPQNEVGQSGDDTQNLPRKGATATSQKSQEETPKLHPNRLGLYIGIAILVICVGGFYAWRRKQR